METAEIMAVLKGVYDPDYRDKSILDLGLVREEDITIRDGEVEVVYGLTAPLCPFSAAIGLLVKYAIEKKLGIPTRVRLRAEHRQAGVVAELLADPQRCEELMRMLEQFGIMERCLRL